MSAKNNLFVNEEEEEENNDRMISDETQTNLESIDSEQMNTEEDDDDPIVKEIPINLAGKDENLHAFQYVSKAKLIGGKLADHPFIAAARYKTKSSVWELDTPLNESAFFNKNKAEEDWNDVKVQTLRGVSVPNEGQYAAFMSEGQAYLVPIKTICQLRPYFKYIDDITQQKKNVEAKQNPNPATQKAQVVTMSVKSVNDPTQIRLAGSLLAHKVVDEEQPLELSWAENTFEQFKASMIKECSEHILKPTETEHEYMKSLI
ncbi:hypothetical protein KAFR_0A03460 [Kazachstania africana CBS 2517]|uniref:DNA-directed RNA polymerase III subunit RPC5 n=1 Tax=Kazachstania africana (strain ATCC 22294 / BCRC 22015 / CBS 2517 / CECT 1963 / NBRC 1671 / NRRL Y-8276) TaxID=1071382 RepID=H2AN31_KAZAF|nr:hypothetical protein KAFR_0A03460 [Kazachstania africana CBS 2517]CCF55781.1 hypothetical protein KAFR_0A03460 [Kazachstania africana CBS 2517]